MASNDRGPAPAEVQLRLNEVTDQYELTDGGKVVATGQLALDEWAEFCDYYGIDG